MKRTLVTVLAAGVLAGCGGDDDTELSPGDELARVTWNAMTAQQQADLCAERSLLGEDVLYAQFMREVNAGFADGMVLIMDMGC